jgi:hypothetical protein
MDPEQNRSELPVKSDSSLPSPQDGSMIPHVTGFFPSSTSIQIDEKIAIAQNEGFSSLAIELAIGSYKTSASHKFSLFALAIIAAALVAFLFPVDRFFKPKTRDLGTMTIGAPISEDKRLLFSEHNEPWLKVLLEMDRLYFREGKLTEAIQVAEKKLAQVPQQKWESWKKVHYRYWELLSDAGRNRSLKAATKSYLQIMPEDPFAIYYAAHAFQAIVDRIPSFNRKTRQAYRSEAKTLIEQIDRSNNALKARQKAQGTKDKKTYLQNLYQKLCLQQAKLYVLIWRLGGYREDSHPDVAYRDKALDISNRTELADLKEAKALKITIYNHILDRWYWFEGQQVIQGTRKRRRTLVEELKELQKELKGAETL